MVCTEYSHCWRFLHGSELSCSPSESSLCVRVCMCILFSQDRSREGTCSKFSATLRKLSYFLSEGLIQDSREIYQNINQAKQCRCPRRKIINFSGHIPLVGYDVPQELWELCRGGWAGGARAQERQQICRAKGPRFPSASPTSFCDKKQLVYIKCIDKWQCRSGFLHIKLVFH